MTSDTSFIVKSIALHSCFPDGSVGKESTCSAGDPGLIPESGRFPGEGKGYPLQYSGLENSIYSPWGSQGVGDFFISLRSC